MWINKPQTILKSALCSKVEIENESELVRIILPKKSDQNQLTERVRRSQCSISFTETGSTGSQSEYKLALTDGIIKLEIINTGSSHPAVKSNWLENVLLTRLNRILKNLDCKTSNASQGYPATLSLIDKETYQSKGRNILTKLVLPG